MSKGLEALKRLVDGDLNEVNYYRQFCDSTTYIMKDKETIEKELKALEIIKDICELKVYKNKLGQCFLEGTNILFPISQETYDSLKEVLL